MTKSSRWTRSGTSGYRGAATRRRLANLQNVANPTFANRLNGDVFLLADAPSPTVFDDRAIDVLHGRGGFDAYFLNLDPVGTDVVSGLHPREQQIDTD